MIRVFRDCEIVYINLKNVLTLIPRIDERSNKDGSCTYSFMIEFTFVDSSSQEFNVFTSTNLDEVCSRMKEFERHCLLND